MSVRIYLVPVPCVLPDPCLPVRCGSLENLLGVRIRIFPYAIPHLNQDTSDQRRMAKSVPSTWLSYPNKYIMYGKQIFCLRYYHLSKNDADNNVRTLCSAVQRQIS